MPLTRLRELVSNQFWFQAKKEVEHLLTTELSPLETAQTHLSGCSVAFNCGEYVSAIRLGALALRWARETGNHAIEADANLLMGNAFLALGDYPSAREHLVAFIDRPATHNRLPEGHFSLGLLAERNQNLDDAIAGYERALALWLREGATVHIVRCYQALAWCYLLLGRPQEAQPYLERVQLQLRVRPEPEVAFQLLAYNALYNRLSGELKSSLTLCQEIFAQSEAPGIKSTHLTTAGWVAGENCLDLGRIPEARAFAEFALSHASKADWAFMISKVSSLCQRALEAEDRST